MRTNFQRDMLLRSENLALETLLSAFPLRLLHTPPIPRMDLWSPVNTPITDRKRGFRMFHLFKSAPREDANYLLLLDKLSAAKHDLDLAYEHFDNATDPTLIDSYIYEVNAMQMRYKFLLSRIKSYHFPSQIE